MANGRMRNVALIGNSADTLILFRLSLLKMLSQEARVYIACPSFSADEKRVIEEAGGVPVELPFTRCGLNPVKEIQSIISICQFLLDNKIDSCFSFFLKPVVYSSLAAWICGVRNRVALIEGLGFVFTPSDENERGIAKLVLKGIMSLLLKITLPLLHHVIFLNEDDSNEIGSICKNLPKTHILGGIGVDIDFFSPVPKNDNGKLTFLFIGRILKEKGVWEFIEAAALNTDHQMEFWMIGGLDSNPSGIGRKTFAKALNNSNVKWFGSVENVKDYLEKCDVFVLPSYREGLPRSTQEAMAMGKPVITTNVEGCRDTVVTGVNGLLVAPRSAKELSTAYNKFFEDRSLLDLYGKGSRKIAEEHYDSKIKDAFLRDIILLNC
jgi:glycosyltransferase involved in cell wall biosynthesis